MERYYRIFGKVVKLNTINSKEGEVLHEELKLYPILNTTTYDVSINYVSQVKIDSTVSNNPSINHLTDDSMVCKLGVTTVKFYFENQQIRQIDFCIDHKSRFKSTIQKWKSIQYASSYEDIGQLFHELVLVPMAFLFDDYSIVHSSGIVNRQDEVVLFGGTGGVGKTSLEMTLCLEHECSFFNDDIAVIDSSGNCYPNFSYPKIYGYNLQGADNLKKEIIKDLAPLNKLHYALRLLKGKNKVRRRIQPEAFYGKTSKTAGKLSSIVILIRSNVDEITLESISEKKVSTFNSLIIGSEYNVFFDHIRWHEFNASALNREPFTTYQSVIEKNTTNLEKGIEGLEKVYLAHIPMHITNSDYKAQMVEKLREYAII